MKKIVDLNNVTENKEFWKSVKLFLSHEVTSFPKISLLENGEIISDESKVANSFSNFFKNAIHSLGIKPNEHSNENYGLKNPVEIAIKKFEQHPSINLINKNVTIGESFHFLPIKQERGSEFLSSKIKFNTQNDVTLRVTNSKIFTEILLSSY